MDNPIHPFQQIAEAIRSLEATGIDTGPTIKAVEAAARETLRATAAFDTATDLNGVIYASLRSWHWAGTEMTRADALVWPGEHDLEGFENSASLDASLNPEAA